MTKKLLTQKEIERLADVESISFGCSIDEYKPDSDVDDTSEDASSRDSRLLLFVRI